MKKKATKKGAIELAVTAETIRQLTPAKGLPGAWGGMGIFTSQPSHVC